MNNSRKQAFINQAEVEEEGLDDLQEDEEGEFDEDEFPLDFEDDDEEDEEDEEDGDMNEEILSAFLTTEEGDNIATVLEQGFANIQKTITIQNQILLKMLSQLSK